MKSIYNLMFFFISYFAMAQSSGFFSKSNYDKEPVVNEVSKPKDSLKSKLIFLKSPVDNARISSKYSNKRLHPVKKVWKAHHGTDFAAPYGSLIKSTASGIVIDENYNSANGNYVKIKHDSIYTTQYLHMSEIKVRKGQIIKQGDIIGLVGSTGLATGAHVCYRFWKNGIQVDPFDLKIDFAKEKTSDETKKQNQEFKTFISGFFKTTN